MAFNFLKVAMLLRHVFSPKKGKVITPATAKEVLRAQPGQEATVPVDFGLSRAEIRRSETTVVFVTEWGEVELALNILGKLADSDKVLFLDVEGQTYVVEVRGEHYYKLRYLGEMTPPTLEIDGVHMHNITGTTPDLDARRKVNSIRVKRGEKGLDICTGLGYTSIEALRRGASVITIEADLNVLQIAEHNPFSRDLAKAEIILGDAFQLLDELPGESFDFILHDPPVFAFAPNLYSLEFYLKLYKVLKPTGRLFHYTGAPGKHRGIDIQRGVSNRLRKAGFTVIRVEEEYGIVAVKR